MLFLMLVVMMVIGMFIHRVTDLDKDEQLFPHDLRPKHIPHSELDFCHFDVYLRSLPKTKK
jgi:hypothetical protein